MRLSKTNRITAMLLTLVMVLTMLPAVTLPAYAEPEPILYQAWDEGSKSVKDVEGGCSENYTVVTDNDTLWGSAGTTTWYVVNGTHTISGRITVRGEVNLILCDEAHLTASQGITVTSGNTLNIYAQSTGDNMGALTANGINDAAGIGGGAGGTITIHGGTVNAYGGNNGAGIGSGKGKASGFITIYGGTVNATGGNYGAGIGGGDGGSCDSVTINGGTVNAHGGLFGVGIGGGSGIVTINGGTVTATAGSSDCVGIGGKNGDHGTLSLSRCVTLYGGGSEDSTTEVAAQEGIYARYWYMKTIYREAVAMPTFSPAGGVYLSEQTLTIGCETKDATIYYTTDGNDPTEQSTQYTAPISISENTIVKAIAVKENMTDSEISSAEYTIKLSMPYQAWDENTRTVEDVPGGCDENYTVVTDSDTAWGSEGYARWYVVQAGTVTISDRINVIGTVNLILCDGANLKASKGITVASGNTLNIYAQSTGDSMGKLTATGSNNEAGIGCKNDICGTITIHGGAVTATGGNNGAGIGGSSEISYLINEVPCGGTVIIYGGSVNSTGGNYAAGIGGGDRGNTNDFTVTIHGGSVTATGGDFGAGIGGGDYGNGCTVTIYGGDVTATSGRDAAGIGGGEKGNGGAVSIYGGNVTAAGKFYDSYGFGAGIGNGNNGSLTLGRGVTLYGDESANPTTELCAEAGAYTGQRFQYMRTSGNPIVIAPTFEPAGGVYNAAQTVKISCGTANAKIYYTTDGTDPTASSKEYTGPIKVSATMTVKAIAVKDSMLNSETVSEAYTIKASIPYQAWDERSSTVKDAPEGISWDGYTAVTSDMSTNWSSGWYVALPGSVDISRRITVSGEVNLLLMDGAALNANAGITVSEGNTLNIYAQSTGENKGKLTATGVDDYKAGIGGEYKANSGDYSKANGGTVTIHGGSVTATGASCGAGIGGGYQGNGGPVTIHGGSVTATAGLYAAGIGGGVRGNGGPVTVNGGDVSATGNVYGAGIGGGQLGTCGTVTINGGNVTARGGVYTVGIGTGDGGNNHGTLILGKGVTLSGGQDSNSIKELASGAGEYTGERCWFMSTTCMESVAFPTISPAGGEYDAAQTVTISCETKGATIYYTTDGSAPTKASAVYTGPISVSSKMTVKAFAVKEGFLESNTASADYTIKASISFQAWDESSKAVKDFPEDINWNDYTTVTSGTTSWSNGWYIVSGAVMISNRITVNGTVNLLLMDGADLTASKGITVAKGNTLNIYAQSTGENKGKLIATGGDYKAGIGSDYSNGCSFGTLTIHGGDVHASAGFYAAGIGCTADDNPNTYTENSGAVIIYGGTVNALGGARAAGIGGGGEQADTGKLSILIQGGDVHASGGYLAAGIGGGEYSRPGKITINGGSVYAISGGSYNMAIGGYAIPGGYVGTMTLGNGMTLYGGQSANPTTELAHGPGTFTVGGNYYMRVSSVGYQAWNGTAVADVPGGYSGAYTVLTSSDTAWGSGVDTSWFVVNGELAISERITVSGIVNLILCDGSDLTAEKGITVASGNTLNVYAQSTGENRGKLTVTGADDYAAGIGGNSGSCGTVAIHGGTVTATGGNHGAGIGGGYYGAGGSITIYGGSVTATGINHGAGIGGGNEGAGGNITIYGDSVNAESYEGAGIGGGDHGGGGMITIRDGIVSASSEYGAGIGGGFLANGGDVTINGGTITAFSTRKTAGGQGYGKGIGAGKNEVTNDSEHGSLTLGKGVTLYGGNNAPSTEIASEPGIYSGTRYEYMSTSFVPSVATPTFSPAEGEYTTAQTVTISCETEGSTIYYTTDGSDPTVQSNEYTASISISENTTVKAIAVKPGLAESNTATAEYYINYPAVAPAFSPAGGAYTSALTVTIRTETEGAAIYYTTDGSEPTTESTKYTGPITVFRTSTVKAIAVKENKPYSTVESAAYIIRKGYQSITAADVTATYGETGKSVSGTSSGGGTISYAVKSGDAVTVDAATGALTILKAGMAVVTVTAAETANCNAAAKDVTVTVGKADPVATAPEGLTAIYGQTLADISLTNPNGNTPGTWAWANNTASVGNAGTNTFKAGFTPDDTENYNSKSNIDVTVTVSKAENPATVLGTASVTRDGHDVDLSHNVVLNGAAGTVSYAVSGDAIGCTLNGSTLTSGNSTGSLIVIVSITADDNYLAMTQAAITVTVSEKQAQTITASDVTATYGDTNKTISATASDNGTISYAVTAGSEEYIDVDSSTGALTIRKVPANGKAYVTVIAGETADYNEATKVVTVTIYKADQTITADNVGVTYGETGKSVSASAIGGGTLRYAVTSGEAVSVDAATGELTINKAGTATVTVTASETANYNADTKDVTVTVSKADQTITAEDVNISYGETGKSISAAAIGDGTLRYAVTSGDAVTVNPFNGVLTINKAGTATVTVTASETANYNETTKDVTVTVSKADQTITAADVNAAYGDVGKSISAAAIGGGTLSYAVTSGDAVAVDASTGALTISKAGTATVTVTAEETANYKGASQVVTVTVSKAHLVVTVKPNTITYSDEPAGNGIEYSGFVNSDTEDVLNGTLSYAYSYTQYGDVGDNYIITSGGLSADNYDIVFMPGKLTVDQKEVGLTWSSDVLSFNGESQAPTATATGIVNGDVISVTVSGGQTDAGTGYIATASGLTGDKAGNYKLPDDNTTTFSIGKAAAQVVSDVALTKVTGTTVITASVAGKMPANAGTLTYNKGEASVTGGHESSVNSWSVDASGSVSASVNSVAGDTIIFPVTVSSTNYGDSTVRVVVSIVNKSDAVVTVTGDSIKTYGNAEFTLTGNVTNTGENGVWTWTSSNEAVAKVTASGVVTIIGGGTADITAVYESDTTIGSAMMTLTVNSKTVTVPSAATDLKWTGNAQTGVDSGEGYTVTNGTAAAVGNYTATAVLTSAVNYKWNDGTTETKSITWSIGRAEGPSAPTGLSSVAPTVALSDGKITGVDTTMEYSSDGTNYTSCTGTEITDLTQGTYYVRVAQTATHEAGAAATVTVPAYNASAYDVSVTAGEGMTKKTGSGAEDQTGLSGAMMDVVYTANDRYYFPENYSVTSVSGIIVTRNSYTQITVHGTPTANATITLPAATEKTVPNAPTTAAVVNCTTESNNDGKLTGVTAAMEYRKSDDASWTDGTGNDIPELVPGIYYVRFKATDTTFASGNQELTITGYVAPSTVATPAFSPAGGTYSSVQTVTISCNTNGATIHYTTDGNDPTANSSAYSSPITVASTTTVKAIAVKAGMTSSAIASAVYTISIPSGGGDTPSGGGGSIPSGGGGGGNSAGSSTSTVPVSGEDASVDVSVEVKGDTASVKDADIDKVLDAKEVGTVTVDVSTLNKDVTSVVIPADMVEKIADAVADGNKNTDGLEIKLPGASVSFDAAAVEAIAEQTKDSDLKLNIDSIKVTEMSSLQQNAVRDLTVIAVVDAYLTSNGQRISDFKGGTATVSIPYTLKDGQSAQGIAVWYVAADGSRTIVPARYAGGNVVFSVGHFSDYVIAYDEERAKECPKDASCPIGSFRDAVPYAWYHDGVHWALETGVMQGFEDGLFRPDTSASRAMIAMMLWNLEGKPAAKNAPADFPDVPKNAWYADAVRWAVSEGIFTGEADGMFHGDHPVLREQIISILYRHAAKRGIDVSASADLAFRDNGQIDDYAIPAMRWAVATGLFKGEDGCIYAYRGASRAEVATMLMRYITGIDSGK